MTKTLTEQWREGKLKGGMYFWRLPNNETFMETLYKMDEYKQTRDASQIVCLAPVPDYMDCKRLMNDSIELDKAKIKIYELVSKTEQLKKKLAIATKALRYYAQCKHINLDLVTIRDDCAEFEAFDDGGTRKESPKRNGRCKMKDRWKFCQCCYLNGHCENQDRDMKCEHYSKQLEDKVERLQEQIKDANYVIDACCSLPETNWVVIDSYKEKWGVE